MKKKLLIGIFTLALGNGFHLNAMEASHEQDVPSGEAAVEKATTPSKKELTDELFRIVGLPNIDAEALEAVKSLIDRGADVNAEGSKRSTPLHEAAYNGHNDICNLSDLSSPKGAP